MSQFGSKWFIIILSFFVSIPALAVRDDILVIVNDNSIDSPQVGSYYATKRGVNPNHIVHVSVPDNYFMNWTQFKLLRDQVIKFLQTNTFADPTVTPVVCSGGNSPYYCQESVDQIRANTKIKYIVTTRGVPTKVKVDGSTLFEPNSQASVDAYLKYWLLRYFTQDVALKFDEREIAFGDGGGMRTVDVAHDGEFIIGRIDGLTLQATLDLIDRTIRVEENGIFGKMFSTVAAINWRDFSQGGSFGSYVYPPQYGDSPVYYAWRYQLGIFGENRQECLDYLNFAGNTTAGKSPTQCLVQYNDDINTGGGVIVVNRPPPGTAGSRQPKPVDGLFYNGWLDNQGMSSGSFSSMLNWRKTESACTTLCENTSDPQACRVASTDVFHEINTQCVGAADGFMGYQHQSYPFSYFTIWPTGYTGPGSGDYDQLAFSEVREDIGHNDNFSLWFRNTDQVASPKCFTTSDFSSAPTATCLDERKLYLMHNSVSANIPVDPTVAQNFQLSFYIKTENITKISNLTAGMQTHDPTPNVWVTTLASNFTTIQLGSKDWTQVTANFTLDPTKYTSPNIDLIRFYIYSSSSFIGNVGIDGITFTNLSNQTNYAINGEFTQGHKQNATGDHGSNILNRLNGVAAWGSLSHHQSAGLAFAWGNLSTSVFFFRGLPLGDSVWYSESNNSGVFYGDPVYSPVAVRINPIGPTEAMGQIKIFGSAINGRNPNLVTTTYSLEYCEARTYQILDPLTFQLVNIQVGDFFECDKIPGAWLSTGVSGTGPIENGQLGIWQADQLPTSKYILRLAVTSTNNASGKSQTYYDYLSLDVQRDSDSDGVPDVNDNCTLVANGPRTYPSPTQAHLIQRDSNNDGFGNVCDADYNNDGIVNLIDLGIFRNYFGKTNDGTQTFADVDANGDGIINLLEFGYFRSQFGKAPGPAGEL